MSSQRQVRCISPGARGRGADAKVTRLERHFGRQVVKQGPRGIGWRVFTLNKDETEVIAHRDVPEWLAARCEAGFQIDPTGRRPDAFEFWVDRERLIDEARD